MADSTHMSPTPPESPTSVPSADSEQTPEPNVSADALLELLGDEYTYRVFEAVLEQPRTGREVIEATDVSKATAYRRLDELEEAGLVETTMHVDEDGHHCKRFHGVVESVRVGFGENGFTARVEPRTPSETTWGNSARRQSVADD